MLRRRYPADGRTVDQQDVYAVARWLKDVGHGPLLDEQAQRSGKMVVFVRDNDNRRLVSYSMDCE